MKVVCLLLALAVAGAWASDVVTLTSENFDEVINNNEFVLVEFFAPWCGHCKRLAPEYEKAATALKADGIVLGAVDATVERDLGSKFGVRGYPTLKLFKGGEATEYKGGRTEDTIINYVRKATGPPAKELADAAAVSEFKEGNKVAIVGFFSELSGDAYDQFIATAKGDEDNVYGVTTSAEAASDAGVSAPAVVLFKQFDEGKNVFDGEFTKSAIADFVTAHRLPNVIPFSMDVVGEIFQSKLGKVAFLFSDTENSDFSELAKSYKGKLVFTVADSSNSRLNSHIGVTKDDFPIFYILTTDGQMRKYPMEGEPTSDAMRAHIDAFLDGSLKPSFKSEPIPESNDGPVTVIVGKNFDDIVLDENKDVLLEVYAPWCGHCKKLEPIYNELGELYKENPNLVIAKMDGTANEVDGLSVRGFPTLKFYKKGASKSRAGADYRGGRELADFKSFLEENAASLKDSEKHDEL